MSEEDNEPSLNHNCKAFVLLSDQTRQSLHFSHETKIPKTSSHLDVLVELFCEDMARFQTLKYLSQVLKGKEAVEFSENLLNAINQLDLDNAHSKEMVQVLLRLFLNHQTWSKQLIDLLLRLLFSQLSRLSLVQTKAKRVNDLVQLLR